MISVRFQGKAFNITVIRAYAPISNAEEAEVEQFYEVLQDLLELRLEALVPSRDSRARTRSPSPRAWRPDFPGAAREAP